MIADVGNALRLFKYAMRIRFKPAILPSKKKRTHTFTHRKGRKHLTICDFLPFKNV